MPDWYMLKAALWYAEQGWRVFPCIPRQKEPAIKRWQVLATTDPKQIEAWWTTRAENNIGLACGASSGVFVVDIDQHAEDGEATLAKAQKRLGRLPDTAEQRTGGGGRQLFFAYPDGREMRNSAGKIGPGVDTRGNGGFVVVPPSLHPSGKRYEWLAWPHHVPPGELPDAWVRKLEKKRQTVIQAPVTPMPCVSNRTLERLLRQVRGQTEGNRHCTLYAVARDVQEKQLVGLVPPGDHDGHLLECAIASGLPEAEARRVLSDARRGKHGG